MRHAYQLVFHPLVSTNRHCWLGQPSSHQCPMQTLKLIVVMVIFCILSLVVSNAQNLAAFKIPDSARPYVFMLRLPSQDGLPDHSTNATSLGVEGLETILAKEF